MREKRQRVRALRGSENDGWIPWSIPQELLATWGLVCIVLRKEDFA